MRTRARRSWAAIAIGATGLAIASAATATAAGGPAVGGAPVVRAQAGSGDVPVLGRTTIRIMREAGKSQVVALVHGVRRVPGGTVLYWSAGIPKDADPDGYGYYSVTETRPLQDRFGDGGNLGAVYLVDGAGHKVYSVLVDKPDGAALATSNDAFDSTPGTLTVLYAVFPELPADVRTVDVVVGSHDVVAEVPVQDGTLEPAKPAGTPIRLGEGWPAIDLDAVRSSHRPEEGVYTWATEIVDGDVTTRQRSKDVSVDLAADVLFAVDSDRLTAASRQALATAAATINKKASGGALTVVGHTDSSGSDAHNDDLSKRRAQAVATALRPLVTVPGVTWQVAGKGEREPVEPNDSAEGRKANRRVSVVFTPKEGA